MGTCAHLLDQFDHLLYHKFTNNSSNLPMLFYPSEHFCYESYSELIMIPCLCPSY